ncbi:hypothetical protein, partial [Bacteroides thetaiotaomicron]|uniref:hypothetical protein n=1 Tax=Bacteroides thetaiotaomicron TaxID=818 RepID=UPI0039C367C9
IQTGKYIEIYCHTNGRKTEIESEKKRIRRFFSQKDDIAETLTLLPCKQAIFRVSLIHICGISH